jgi:prophage tail gpP-like protein
VKRFLAGFAAAALVLAGAPLGAQQQPNLSGNWKMNQVKSDFGPAPAPDVFTRKIVHAEPAITIDEVQTSPLGEQATSRKITTDGKEGTFEVSGAQVKATAKWEGNTLVVVSTVPAIGISYNDQMSLSPDGKVLTSVVKLDTPDGALDIKVVFEKQ